ncbi:MAG: hypothetical protein EXS49_02595 [Candidatus Pacebacteria bacterium]|nr:hypothetical protein [Candidatus Paceibacterota bacterium]
MKILGKIFLVSFFLNFIWENLHVFLYDNFMGGEITELILLRASFVDAIIISVISLPFLYFGFLKSREWIMILIGFVWAIAMECYALNTERWAYNNLMPIIPLINVGLTPTIQLGLLGFISFKIVVKK